MATYVFENVDNELFTQFKKFADSLGVGFQVFDKPEKTEMLNSRQPSNQLPMPSDDILSYAGILRGAWGETPEKVDKALQEMRSEWER